MIANSEANLRSEVEDVFRQIYMGWPLARIRDELSSRGLTSDEIEQVIRTAKERYIEDQRELCQYHRGEATNYLLIGAALFATPLLIVAMLGEPSAGRFIGMKNFAMVAGAAGMIYGAYRWMTAGPDDTRTDLD